MCGRVPLDRSIGAASRSHGGGTPSCVYVGDAPASQEIMDGRGSCCCCPMCCCCLVHE